MTTTVTFAPGEASKTVDVLVEGDVVHEVNETYAVDLANPVGAGLADANGVGTIVDDDAAPILDVADVTVTEGNAGDVTASFPVTLTGATQVPVTVDVATADGTATDPSDYAAVTGSLTFAPGQTAKTVDVLVHGDTTFELGETFTLHLSNPTAATIGRRPRLRHDPERRRHTGPHRGRRVAPRGRHRRLDSPSFTVALGAPSAFPVTVDVATQDGTATQPSDYDAMTTTLTFAPGETTKTVDVTIHGDTTIEPNESFSVQLSNAVGAGIADSVGDGVIVDDDLRAAPGATRVDPRCVRPGRQRGRPPRSRSPSALSFASTGDVTIAFRTTDGTATGGTDYEQDARNRHDPHRLDHGKHRHPGDRRRCGRARRDVLAEDRDRRRRPSRHRRHRHDHERRPAATNLILRAKGRHHHVVSRGRMLHAEPGMKVRVVLLRQTDDGFLPIARTTVPVHIQSRGGVPTGIFTTRFTHQRFGRYVVRAIYRGDETHLPSHARARVRL